MVKFQTIIIFIILKLKLQQTLKLQKKRKNSAADWPRLERAF